MLDKPQSGWTSRQLRQWCGRLVDFVKSLQVRGDGKTTVVKSTAGGKVISVIPQSSGGSGGGSKVKLGDGFKYDAETGRIVEFDLQDNSAFEFDPETGKLRVYVDTANIADAAVTNDKLAGSNNNENLVNPSITINGQQVNLGGSVNTPDTNTWRPVSGVYFDLDENSYMKIKTDAPLLEIDSSAETDGTATGGKWTMGKDDIINVVAGAGIGIVTSATGFKIVSLLNPGDGLDLTGNVFSLAVDSTYFGFENGKLKFLGNALPDGTADGQLLEWDHTNQKWIVATGTYVKLAETQNANQVLCGDGVFRNLA